MPNILNAIEVWGPSLSSAIVTAGGTSVPPPSSGTQETWTFSGSTLPTASSTYTNATPPLGFYIQDLNNPSETMAVINTSGSTWTVVRGADGTTPSPHTTPFTVVQVASGNSYAAAQSFWEPVHNGLLDANMPIDTPSGTLLLSAGVVYLAKIVPRFSYTATRVWIFQSSVPAGASTGTFVGLYSQTGTLLTGSADQGTNLVANTVTSCTLTSAQSITVGVAYYVALLVNFATTQPTVRTAAGGSNATPNVNLSNAQSRGASSGTAQTTLPASITMSGLTQNNVMMTAIN